MLTALLFLVTGCTTVQLQGGKYAGKDRGEFAMVYGDLIFLRVKAGKNIPDDMTNNIDFSQDIGKILFAVCCEAEKQGIDSDLALREYTKNVMDKAKRDEL